MMPLHQITHLLKIRHHDTLKPHLLPQCRLHILPIHRHRHPIHLTITLHHRHHTRVNHLPKRLHKILPHPPPRNTRRRPIMTRQRITIPHKMLRTSRTTLLLNPIHPLHAHSRHHERVLPQSLIKPTPQRLHSQPENRREQPWYTRRATVFSAGACHLVRVARAEGCGDVEGLGGEYSVGDVVGTVDCVDGGEDGGFLVLEGEGAEEGEVGLPFGGGPESWFGGVED
mmetsp:Transcript_26542/g.32124  ORF Transcript_26542/g.32124 Transcript_26542/m.32124 type:complete len:227 (+) Transcript_26542:2157-2837(+)